MIVPELKPLVWMGGSKRDIRRMPKPVRKLFGFALRLAQQGLRHADAKSLRGFGGGTVIEVVEDFDKNTYRAVYTLRFEGVVYALHVFQKKSKKGSKTPRVDLELIRKRLKDAETEYGSRRRGKMKKRAESRRAAAMSSKTWISKMPGSWRLSPIWSPQFIERSQPEDSKIRPRRPCSWGSTNRESQS